MDLMYDASTTFAIPIYLLFQVFCYLYIVLRRGTGKSEKNMGLRM